MSISKRERGRRAEIVVLVMLAAWAIAPGIERSAAYAEILNADSFNYTVGDTLNNKSGGTGWSGSNPQWNDSEGDYEIVDQSLEYQEPNGDRALVTSGNRVERIGSQNTARREYTTGDSGDVTFGDDANDPNPVWFSALVQGDPNNAAQSIVRPAEDAIVSTGQGFPGSDKTTIHFHESQTPTSTDTGVTPTDDEPGDPDNDTTPSHNDADMLVTKVNFNTDANGNETAKLWVNPKQLDFNTLDQPGDAQGFAEFVDFAAINVTKVGFLANFNGAAFDEMRMGTSFSDVSPRTPLPPSFALGASCLGMAAAGRWWRRRRARRVAAEADA